MHQITPNICSLQDSEYSDWVQSRLRSLHLEKNIYFGHFTEFIPVKLLFLATHPLLFYWCVLVSAAPSIPNSRLSCMCYISQALGSCDKTTGLHDLYCPSLQCFTVMSPPKSSHKRTLLFHNACLY